jgi:hypothetical protein
VTPPRATVRVGAGTATLTFWIAPHVTGTVPGAVVAVRQEGHTLSEIPLDVKVARPTLAVLAGALTFCLPGLSAVAKHFRVDFESQLSSGFDLYLTAARWLLGLPRLR